MGPYPPQGASLWIYAIPLAFIVLAMLRGARKRRLRIERMWIAPAVILLATGLAFYAQPTPRPLWAGIGLAALGAGAVLGWWRGRFTTIAVDAATHDLTSQASPLGMILVLAIMAVRLGLRGYVTRNAGALHASVNDITDAFLLLAVGVVCANRLEMALRATRLLAEARKAP